MPRSPSQPRPVPLIGSLLLGLLAGCGGDDPAPGAGGASPDVRAVHPHFPVTVRDDEGRTVTLEHPPERIIALVPSATEALGALGLQELLVGRTDFDRDPEVAHLPSVGGGLEPSPERLIALEPDLVIRFAAESDRVTPVHLDRARIPHMAIRPDRIRDIRRILRLLGEVTGHPDDARELVEAMDRELDRVAAQVRDAPRPRVAFLLGGDPPWIVGPGTFLHELLEVAGARNAFQDLEGNYAPVSVEEVVRREVELILALEGARVPGALSYLPLRRVPDRVQAPGHRVGESARTLARVLHPELVP